MWFMSFKTLFVRPALKGWLLGSLSSELQRGQWLQLPVASGRAQQSFAWDPQCWPWPMQTQILLQRVSC